MSLWLMRPGVGYIFMVSLCRVSFCVQLLFPFYYLFFSFLFWLCPFLNNRIFWFRFVFRFLVFYLILVKPESCLQKNHLSSFNLVLTWFGYRGFFFLSHDISLWFCDVSKLRWFFNFLYNSFQPG